MFLISVSTSFGIITSVLIFILLISVKSRKENIRLRSSQCLLPRPAPAKLCHDLLMLVSLPCCPTQVIFMAVSTEIRALGISSTFALSPSFCGKRVECYFYLE